MKIAHFSDLHGDYGILEHIEKPDLWVCTGDFFPNFTRPRTGKDRIETERERQTEWLIDNLEQINTYLRDVPIIWTNGNHDFIKPFGISNLTYLEEGIYTEWNGFIFAGFPEIPQLNGFWSGEVGMEEMIRICRNVFSKEINILLTHTPPRGILDNIAYYGFDSVGSIPLRDYIFESEVVLHCFGHIHEEGGKTRKMAGTVFSNAATVFNTIEV